ncbi:MAG: hypothetical protein ACOH5I_01825 [Oligoflexus sp.]
MRKCFRTLSLIYLLSMPEFSLAQNTGVGDQEYLEMAYQSLQILGADIEGSRNLCSGCHNTTDTQTLRRWTYQARDLSRCLDRHEGEDALRIIQSCLVSEESRDSEWQYSSQKLGFYSAAAHLSDFASLFQEAYGEAGEAQHQKFIKQAGMPFRSGKNLSQDDFNLVYTWLRMGTPYLEELTQYTGPKTCETFISSSMHEHLDEMQRFGWQAKNEAEGILMFACSSSSPLDCFQQKKVDGQSVFPRSQDIPFASNWHESFPDANIRLLRSIDREIRYWSRSSADGRFIASGGYPSFIIDLAAQLADEPYHRDITVDAYFDPSFFPDNSGFIFQGEKTGICRQSILQKNSTSHIDFTEAECQAHDAFQVPLYQAVGQSLDGEDYLAITGSFISDSGYPDQLLSSQSYQLEITPFLFNGDSYEPGQVWRHPSPYQLDWNISPSGRILVSRQIGLVNGKLTDLGFHFYRRQLITHSPTDESDYTLEKLASICSKGMKGKFSFNENLFVTYRYLQEEDYAEWGFADAQDPEFQSWLKKGMANLYLLDMRNGESKRITQLKPGQFALFPHFRSDGWIYFQVLDHDSNQRYFFASDAALHVH